MCAPVYRAHMRPLSLSTCLCLLPLACGDAQGTGTSNDGLVGPYTYSDMTGWGLSNVANPQG